MMLVRCPDCETPVSSKATACPKCGRPLRPLTTESTGKFWKTIQLFSGLLLLGGIGVVALGVSRAGAGVEVIGRALSQASSVSGLASFTSMEFPAQVVVLGAAMVMVAIPLGIFSRLGSWWFHG